MQCAPLIVRPDELCWGKCPPGRLQRKHCSVDLEWGGRRTQSASREPGSRSVCAVTSRARLTSSVQESVVVTVDVPAEDVEKGGGEYLPLGSLRRPWGEQEEEEDTAVLVVSPPPSRKKSTSMPQRARISSRPALDMLDVVSWQGRVGWDVTIVYPQLDSSHAPGRGEDDVRHSDSLSLSSYIHICPSS